jgi:hypothetical protein
LRFYIFDQFNLAHRSLLIRPDFRVTPVIQLYVVARFQLYSALDCLNSFVRYLWLYSTGQIPKLTAAGCLKAIDKAIGKYFGQCQGELLDFHPSAVLKSLPTESVEWILGAKMLKAIGEIEKLGGNGSLLITTVAAIQEFEKIEPDLPIHYHEMRAIKFFHGLKFAIGAIRRNKFDFTEVNDILAAVFGSVTSSPSLDTIERFMAACTKIASEAQQKYIAELEAKQQTLNASCVDWRFLYARRLRPQLVLRDLILSGFQLELPTDDFCIGCANFFSEFVGRFSDLTAKYAKFVGILEPGKQFCTPAAVLALRYYLEVLRISRDVGVLESSVVDELIATQSGQDGRIANMDIPAVLFAKQLRKTGNVPVARALAAILPANDEFLFRVETSRGLIIIRGFVNPTNFVQ